MKLRNGWPNVLALVFTLTLLSGATVQERVLPLRTIAVVSSSSDVSNWSVPIKGPDGRILYVLTLEPDFYVGHHLEAVTLVLRGASDRARAPNLLKPTGIWHGMQPCDFVANDLAHGAAKSVFGEKRKIGIDKLALVLSVTILNAAVSRVSDEDYQLDAMNLQIEVNNSVP